MADPCLHNLTAQIPNETGYSFHHQKTQSFGNEGCQSADYFGYSVAQLCSPSRKTVEDHRENGGDSPPSQATTKEADNPKENISTKQNASTMTQGEFGFNSPFTFSPGYSMAPSHSPYELYCKRESSFSPPFVGTHPYCNYFYLPSIFPNAIPYCSNLCYQHQESEHTDKNSIRRNSEQTRNKSNLGSNHEDSNELESTPNFDTSASHPPQNTWKYPYYPPCVISNQNKICYHPLVPVVVPSCYFDSHHLSSQNMLSESQTTEEHLDKQCTQNREHIIIHEYDSDLTSPSPSVLSNNVSTVDLSSPECSMPQSTVLSKESNSPHLSSSLYYSASEQEQKHNGLQGNEEGDAHVNGRDSDKIMKDFCKYEHKNTVSGLKKSRIPKISKPNIPPPMSDHKNKNNATESHNNAILSVSNQGNADENKSLKGICKLSPVNTKLKHNFPQQIVKKNQQEICHSKPLEEVHNSKNEMKYTLYQSEIHGDSVSLNMLNIRNNSEDNHAETSQNVKISEKFAMPRTNTNSINNFKVQHNSRSKINVVGLQEDQKTGQSHITTNENQPLQRDGSPSPEIDLDRLALQLILNNQGSEDGDMGDIDEEYEQIDHMDQTKKNEGPVRQTSILDRDIELQNVLVEDKVYKLYHEKSKMISKFSNVHGIINNQEDSILNIQRTDNTTDMTNINNGQLYKEESSKIWQGGEPIENTSSVSHQQICDLAENDYCSEYSSPGVESECSYHYSEPSIPVSLSLDSSMSSAAKLIISFLAKQQGAKNCNGNVEEGQGVIWNKNVEGLLNRITARHEKNINSVPTQDISSTIIQNNSEISQKRDSDHEQKTNNLKQKPSDYREISKTTTNNSLPPELRDNSSSLLSETQKSVPNYPQKKLHLKKSNPPTGRQNPQTQKPTNHNFVWENGSHKCSY